MKVKTDWKLIATIVITMTALAVSVTCVAGVAINTMIAQPECQMDGSFCDE